MDADNPQRSPNQIPFETQLFLFRASSTTTRRDSHQATGPGPSHKGKATAQQSLLVDSMSRDKVESTQRLKFGEFRQRVSARRGTSTTPPPFLKYNKKIVDSAGCQNIQLHRLQNSKKDRLASPRLGGDFWRSHIIERDEEPNTNIARDYQIGRGGTIYFVLRRRVIRDSLRGICSF